MIPLFFSLLAGPVPPVPVPTPLPTAAVPMAAVPMAAVPSKAAVLAPVLPAVPVITAALDTKRLRLMSQIIPYDGSRLDPAKVCHLDFFLANDYSVASGPGYTLPKNAVTVWLSPKLTLDMATATPGLTLKKTANGQLLTLAYADLPPMAGRRYSVSLTPSAVMPGSVDQFTLYALTLPKTTMYTFLLQGKSDIIKRPSDGALVPLSTKSNAKAKAGPAYLSVRKLPKAAKRRHAQKQH